MFFIRTLTQPYTNDTKEAIKKCALLGGDAAIGAVTGASLDQAFHLISNHSFQLSPSTAYIAAACAAVLLAAESGLWGWKTCENGGCSSQYQDIANAEDGAAGPTDQTPLVQTNRSSFWCCGPSCCEPQDEESVQVYDDTAVYAEVPENSPAFNS